MTTKHEIDIPDLPDGWEAVAYGIALRGVDYVLRNGKVTIYNGFSDNENLLIVKKIKPRRIVLEETDEPNSNADMQEFSVPGASIQLRCSRKYWRVIEE